MHLFATFLLLLAFGPSTSLAATDAAPAPHPKVLIQTNQGELIVELDADRAPLTVENFLGYVQEGAYDGTIFHRVIDGFMIQGGGYTGDYQRKPTHAPIRNEADNGLKNLRGTIAMARTGDPHSATAQFFINVVDNSFLDFSAKTSQGWGYTVFGRVIHGMDVVDRIKAQPTGHGGPFPKDVPQTPVVIDKAIVIAPPQPAPATEPTAESDTEPTAQQPQPSETASLPSDASEQAPATKESAAAQSTPTP